jgi:hypothetical protein
MARRAFLARYPGHCTCGASFEQGDRIAWSVRLRRATICPACQPVKAVQGETQLLDGVLVRVDTHPQTGAPAVVSLGTAEEPTPEVYRLRNSRWVLCSGSVFFSLLSHEDVERWISRFSQVAA